ncbi:MAG TPA: hypothetical protein VGG46_00585 [Terriglobales bacterium]|jgi:hypothetical protein
MKPSIKRISILVVVFAVSAPAALAQQDSDSSSDNSPSLAAIAKESKKKAAAHPTVITDEDMSFKAGPLPKLSLDEKDNSDEVVQAVGEFQAKHKPEETERVVHDWYDRYDDMLATALRENSQTVQRRQFTTSSGYWICQNEPNYQNCVERRNQELRGSFDDQSSMRDNFRIINRVQQEFMMVRSGLAKYNLHYSWFKVRNANGVGSF